MIFDSNGLPKDTGATDFMDSARSAGMMATFGHPSMNKDLISKYVINHDQAVRYPFIDPYNAASNNPKNFTRDQLNCLASGLYSMGRSDLCELLLEAAEKRLYFAQDTEADVVGSTKKFPNGPDPLWPDSMNNLRMCAGQKSTLLGKAWLLVSIVYNAKFDQMGEPNQLMCMCKVAGPMYVKLLRKLNPKLDDAIRSYWVARQESAFAEFLIDNFK